MGSSAEERVRQLLEGRLGERHPSSRERPSRRIFRVFDLFAALFATYAMVASTPIGGLVVRAYGLVFDRDVGARPLVSYFRGDSDSRSNGGPDGEHGAHDRGRDGMTSGDGAPGVSEGDGNLVDGRDPASGLTGLDEAERARLLLVITRPRRAEAVTRLAEENGLEPALARALLVVTSDGRLGSDGGFDVTFPAAAGASFSSVGAGLPSPSASALERQAVLIRGVGLLARALGNDEAAALALTVPVEEVRHALHRTRRGGADASLDYQDFRRFLPPNSRRRGDALARGAFALRTVFRMTWPVQSDVEISSGFGMRRHPVLGTLRLHRGTDLRTGEGMEIWAAADGQVQTATEDSVNGRFIELDHGYGLTSTYCHNSSLFVRRGSEVARGQTVALSGSTGRVTGPHLHFEIELDGQAIDPELIRP